MSEPVAWRVLVSAGWFLFVDKSEAARYCADDEEPDPLYTADELECKDAVIAELLSRLRDCSESLGRFCSDEGWMQIDMDRMDNADSTIAKYDRAES